MTGTIRPLPIRRAVDIACAVTFVLALTWCASRSVHFVEVAPEIPAAAAAAHVTRVVDGDTIVVDDGVTDDQVIRLVGVDTPETVDPNRPVGCFGAEASTFTTDELTDRDVYLEVDAVQGDTDKYGRELRYVWIAGTNDEPDQLFNATLLEQGFAVAYRGDHTRKLEFDALESSAKSQGAGLWGSCPATG
jgi:endonuclease YncB( thermonuclease family)